MGVCSHSTTEFWDEFIIFAIDEDYPGLDIHKVFTDHLRYKGFGFKPLVGCYKGVEETSYIVNFRHWDSLYPWFRDQESVLYLSPMKRTGNYYNRRATLLMLNDRSSCDLGWWCRTHKDNARKLDAWTHDPSDGSYWITRE